VRHPLLRVVRSTSVSVTVVRHLSLFSLGSTSYDNVEQNAAQRPRMPGS
jgi:hypothetical protein